MNMVLCNKYKLSMPIEDPGFPKVLTPQYQIKKKKKKSLPTAGVLALPCQAVKGIFPTIWLANANL